MVGHEPLKLVMLVRLQPLHPIKVNTWPGLTIYFYIFYFLERMIFQTPSAMSTLITSFGEVATAVFTQVTEIASTIVETPLLLFTTGFLFLGGCVGIFGRLLSRN